MSSGVMILAILVTASFWVASILHVPFFVLLDMLPLLVEAVLGNFCCCFCCVLGGERLMLVIICQTYGLR
jgi:hypothetical protein